MMTTISRLFPRPKEFGQHGRARRFDPAAGIVLRTVGSGDFARAREVIADELAKAFPQAAISDAPGEPGGWELRLSLGFRRPEPEAYRLVVAGNRIEITGATWRGLLCGWEFRRSTKQFTEAGYSFFRSSFLSEEVLV